MLGRIVGVKFTGVLGCAIAVFGCSLLASGQTAPAGLSWVSFHQNNDRFWATRSGLPVEDVRRLRLAARIQDDQPSDPIELIDSRSLGRGQVLLVTNTGDLHCLNVELYGRRWNNAFRKLWSVDATPTNKAFCRPRTCRKPSVSVVKKGEISVMLPRAVSPADIACDENEVLTYKWRKRSYELTADQTIPAQCGLDSYDHAVNLEFDQAIGAGEALAMVEVLPSFRPEYAIAIQRTSDGISVYRLQARQPLAGELGLFTKRQTASQCIEYARTVSVDRTVIPMPSQQVEDFISTLQKIDFQTDRCPRRRTGDCAFFLDGTSIVVRRLGGATARLTDIDGSNNVISENLELYRWAKKFLRAAKVAETGTSAVGQSD
jgi:hypothetical protein